MDVVRGKGGRGVVTVLAVASLVRCILVRVAKSA